MRLVIINQDPIQVTNDQARQIGETILSGAESIFVNGEMVKTSAIMGIRKDNQPDSQATTNWLWGKTPQHLIDEMSKENREQHGDGYKKFQELKSRLLSR
mgnify:CR=1 FL=1